MTRPDILTLAEDVLSVRVETAQAAQSLASHLRETGLWLETVPGLDSVAVRFDIARLDPVSAATHLSQAHLSFTTQAPVEAEILTIPVEYGGEHGPDLEAVSNALSLPEEAIIARHCNPLYSVDMIGFTPGFAYLGGLDETLSVPRRSTPRTHVPAGSIGISGLYGGLYALPGPAGWQLIGRTIKPLFDPAADDPFLIKPGMAIRFEPT